jgi:hypothetical protein
MQVFHTAGVPPNNGRTILAIIGCTRNRRNALKKREIPKGISIFDSQRVMGMAPCVSVGMQEELKLREDYPPVNVGVGKEMT